MNSKDSNIDQAVPYSQEAEEATIGSMLVNPMSLIAVIDIVQPDDFFFLRHTYVFEAMIRVASREDSAIDHLTVSQELRDIGWLDEIGGPAFLAYLVNNTPSHIHAEVYAHLVKRTAFRRRLLAAADEMKVLALNEEIEVEKVAAGAEERLLAVTNQIVRRRGKLYDASVLELLDEIIEIRENKRSAGYGIPLGFTDLDDALDGAEIGDLMVFAARPGMGKTALLLNIALQVKVPVAIFSLEMTEATIRRRMVAAATGVRFNHVRKPDLLTDEELKLVLDYGSEITSTIYIDESPYQTPRLLTMQTRWLQQTMGIQMVIVDGIYKMSSDESTHNDYERVSEVGRGLKRMARTLNIPVLASHQLSRDVEKRKDKRPVMSDLRDSGVLEEEINKLIFLYRDAVYNTDTELPNLTELIIAKNRDGGIGTVKLRFDGSRMQFSDDRVDVNTGLTNKDWRDD